MDDDERLAHCLKCGDDVPSGRTLLGYTTCLACGDKEARKVRHCVAPLNKSNYVMITNYAELAQLNPKRVGG
jgi:hypothetical protein